MPAISVIVPVYNVEKYLQRCIDSILTQTFSDFELILIDDGSPDSSGEICDSYAKKDFRIRVFHIENGGVSRARNYGVSQANGDFVTYIDSDDWVHPDYLKVQYDCLIKSGGDICVTLAQTVFDKSEEKPCICTDFETMTNREAINRYGKYSDSRFRGPVAKLIRTSIAKNNPFPEGRRIAEDLATNYRYYNDADVIINNESVLYFYFANQTSTVNQTYQLWRLKGLDTLEELLSFCKNNDYPELYDYYTEEYANDLFRQYCNVRKYYDDKEIADELFDKLRKFLNLPGLKSAENIYELLSYLDSVHRNDLYSMYALTYISSLYLNSSKAELFGENVEEQKNEMKILIRTNKKRLNITPQTHPEWFNYLYPAKMDVYWTAKGILTKFTKKK